MDVLIEKGSGTRGPWNVWGGDWDTWGILLLGGLLAGIRIHRRARLVRAERHRHEAEPEVEPLAAAVHVPAPDASPAGEREHAGEQ